MSKNINSNNIYITDEISSDYKEIFFNLSQTNHFVIYKYNKNQNQDKTDIILQLNSSSQIPANIYLYNKKDINYDESTGEFKDFINTYKQELGISKEEFVFEVNEPECYIVISIPKLSSYDYVYIGKFIVFKIPVDLSLNEYLINNFYFFSYYGNNYTLQNFDYKYKFKINSNDINLKGNNNIYLHLLIKSNDSIHLKIFDDNNIQLFNNYTSSLDYYLNINDNNIYYIELIALLEEKNFPFSVYFETIDYKNKINYIGNNKTICKNFLGDSKYYFYDYINSQINEPLFYILSNSLFNKEMIIDYIELKNIIKNDFGNINIEELEEISLNRNFTSMKYKKEENNTYYYKYNKNLNNTSNYIIIIRIWAKYSEYLNLNFFCFKKLPFIRINNEYYEQIFNSSNYIDNIAYFYLSYNSDYNKAFDSIILYSNKKNTITLYNGIYDIVDGKESGILNNNKLLKINNIYNNYYSIKVINRQNLNFIFQLFCTSTNAVNLTSIDFNKDNPNKEVYMNESNIKEYYLLNNNEYNNELILDPIIIYGNITIKYFDFDSIEDDLNFSVKNIFNDEFNLEIINSPKKTNSSLELIVLNKNDYSFNKYSQGLIYINRYIPCIDNIFKEEFTPLYLEKKQNIYYEFDNSLNFQTVDYLITFNLKYYELSKNDYAIIIIENQTFYLNSEINFLKGKIYINNNKKIHL